MGIILRQNKGVELTFAEVDGNFQSLIYSASISGSTLTLFYPSSSVSSSISLSELSDITGSFTGSFTGDGSGLTNLTTGSAFPFTGDAEVTGSLRVGFYGGNTLVAGNGSIVGGFNASASLQALAFGNEVIAGGTAGAVAFGNYTHASQNYSFAQGDGTLAGGNSSHAEGTYSTASGIGSHAEGVSTKALGNFSHAEGTSTVAFGSNSHAEGNGTIASGSSQHAQGKFNTQGNNTSLMIIGNGTSDVSRSDLALFNTDGIVFNQPLTASVVSGSFVGDGSGLSGVGAFPYTGSAQITGSLGVTGSIYVTQTASIQHITEAGNELSIDLDGGGFNVTTSDAATFLGSDAWEIISANGGKIFVNDNIEISSSIATQITGSAGITGSLGVIGSTVITGSLTATGLTQGSGSDTVAMYDTGSGQFFYTSSAAIGGAGTSFPYTGSAEITGSLEVIGSTTIKAGSEYTASFADGGFDFYTEGGTPIISLSDLIYLYGAVNANNSSNIFSGSFSGNGQNLTQVSSSYINSGSKISGGVPNRLVYTDTNGNVQADSGNIQFDGTKVTLFRLDTTGQVSVGSTLDVDGNTTITGSLTISSSTSPSLEVVGSGSVLFEVSGSSGSLLTVTDTNTGALLTVTDSASSTMFEVNSDQTFTYGNPGKPGLQTTNTYTVSSTTTIYSFPTASYKGAFIEYTAVSESTARAGKLTSIWIPGTTNVSQSDAQDIFIGDTSALRFGITLSGSNAVVTGSDSGGGTWSVDAIIRGI